MEKLIVRVLTFLDFTIFLPINLVLILIRAICVTIKNEEGEFLGISMLFIAIFEWFRLGFIRLKTGIIDS